MKKLLLCAACLLAASATYASDNVTIETPIEQVVLKDSVDLQTYAGTYKMEGLPFELIELKMENGKLICYAGSYVLELKASAEKDKLESDQATFQFSRDDSKNIKGLHLEAQGMAFEGTKQ